MSGLLYWLSSFVLQPDQPLKLAILYRFGDTDYTDLYYAAARFQFHEFLTEGIEAPRLVPFPYGLAYLYGMPIMLFGDAGFVVGDAIISIARITICMFLMQPFFRTPAARLAAAIVLFTMTGPVPGLSRVWTIFIHPLWDLRNIRPFITGMFALTLVYTTWRVNEGLVAPRPSRVLYLVHGALIGLVMQGDLHTAIIASLATAGVVLTHLVRDPHLVWRILIRISVAALAFAVVVAPMAYQVTQALPDVARRLGQIPLPRTAPPLILASEPLAATAALAVVCAIMLRWRVGGEENAAARRVFAVAVLYALASLAALPLSVIVLGKGVQIYHFAFRADGFTILGFTLAFLLVAQGLSRWLVVPRLALAGVVIVGAVHLAFIGYRGIGQAMTQYQQRPWDTSGWAPITGYHPDLIALWKEISRRPAYADARVLGTFDKQLGMLWATRDGYRVFLPDPFLSTVPDAAIERRLIGFAQLVGMTQAAFDEHLRDEYFYICLLNGMKWQADRFYTFSDLSQYSLDDQYVIAISDWHTIPPNDDMSRLRDLYAQRVSVGGRLDLIVLNRGSSLGDIPGPSADYKKTYENRSFTVWLKSPAREMSR